MFLRGIAGAIISARVLMMPFFNWTGLERLGVVGQEFGLLLGWTAGSGCVTANLQALDVALLYKDKKEEGSVGALPVAAPMPKSVPRREKR